MTGTELAQARKQLGYTRAQFASATGLAASTIARYEMPSNTGQYPIPGWLGTLCALWQCSKGMIPLPARFEGIQESLVPGRPQFALWTIWAAIPGHPYGSTISINTIVEAGYTPVETAEPDKEQP